MDLREEVARVVHDVSWHQAGRLDLQYCADYADRILVIPTIKEALAFHEACQKAFSVNGEFTVTKENIRGKGGVSAS